MDKCQIKTNSVHKDIQYDLLFGFWKIRQRKLTVSIILSRKEETETMVVAGQQQQQKQDLSSTEFLSMEDIDKRFQKIGKFVSSINNKQKSLIFHIIFYFHAL